MSDWGYFGYMIPVRGTWKNESYSRHPETRDLAMGACECQGAPGKLLPPSRYLLSHAVRRLHLPLQCPWGGPQGQEAGLQVRPLS